LANEKLSSDTERLVLVSDTSTEAERLIASLRVRKVKVRDVPLMLLAGRVEAQKPKLVICDGQAPRVVDAIEKMRRGDFGKNVELLLLGIDVRVTDALRPVLADVDHRSFPRPIDVYTVLQRVEEILGESEDVTRGASRSMASLPRVNQNSISAPRVAPSPLPRRGRSSVPQIGLGRGEPSSPGDDAEPAQPKRPSIAPISEPSSPDSSLGAVSVSRMSDELEKLLQDAERRLGPGPVSLQPASLSSARLSPEQELDAILPVDVLAALDEPVDLDDDEETSQPLLRNEQSSSMAPRPGRVSGGARGSDYGELAQPDRAGTAANDEDTPVGRHGARRLATSAGSEPPSVAKTGSVLTPVPASVKTHNTHLGQVGPSGQAAGTIPGTEPSEPTASTAAVKEPSRATNTLEPAYTLRAHTADSSDSVAPGTNPEVAEMESASSAEASSTAPPHPPRSRGDGSMSAWNSVTEEPASLRGSLSRRVTELDAERDRRVDASSSSTSPPLGGAHRNRASFDAEPLSERGKTRLQHPSAPRSNASASFDKSEFEGPPASASPVSVHAQPAPRLPAIPAIPAIPPSPAPHEDRGTIDIPAALGSGDVIRALSRCVRGRYSGALAIEDESGIRRVVFREGDFVMVASGIEGESLVAFLIQRGDLDGDAARLTRKLPQFGRHAGAALIAHGYLRQDELWPVLRAHAEWLLGRALSVSQGSAGLEGELSARLQAEPAVFGGTPGAEVLVEIVRRNVGPEMSIEALGGSKVRITRGAQAQLLGECALSSQEVVLVEQAQAVPLGEILRRAPSPDFASAVYALVELGVLETMAPAVEAASRSDRPPQRDGLDDEAVRARVGLRRALVDEGDYFALLGVAREATGYEVRHAYLSLRREFEPGRLLTASTADLRDDVDLIVEVIDEAYDVLRDPARRERYRRALDAAPR
jgi:hypothetical protein